MPDTKGALQLVITFPEELPTQMPLFFIKNPNYDMCKPNKKHVIFGSADSEEKYFEAVMGGVRVLFPANSNERWQWTPSSYYKQ